MTGCSWRGRGTTDGEELEEKVLGEGVVAAQRRN